MGVFIPKNPKVEAPIYTIRVHVREPGPPPVQTTLDWRSPRQLLCQGRKERQQAVAKVLRGLQGLH